MDYRDDSQNSSKWRTRANWAFAGFAVIAGYFLITEHRAHLQGFVPYLPFLLLAACPLMHIFMHHGHGGHGDHGGTPPRDEKPGAPATGEKAEADSAQSHRHHQH